MKNSILKFIVLSIITTFAFSSCSDYLDKQPDDQLDLESVFENKKNMERWLAYVYRGLPEYYTYDGPDAIADELIPSVGWEAQGFKAIQYQKGNWTADNPGVITYWNTYPKYIRSAYLFIKHAHPLEAVPAEEVDFMKAECRFFIAYYNSMMAIAYGSVPIIREASESTSADDLMLKQEPFYNVIDWADQEMLEASKQLPATQTEDKKYGRVTSVGCLAMRARILLFAASDLVNGNPALANIKNIDGTPIFNSTHDPERWKRAVDACKLVIDEAEASGYHLHYEYLDNGDIDPFLSYQNAVVTVIVICLICGTYTMAWFLIGYLSLVRRIKAGTLWKNSMIRKVLKWIGKCSGKLADFARAFSRNTAEKIKVLLVGGAFLFLQFLIIGCVFSGAGVFLLALMAVDVAVMIFAIRKADGQDRIMDGLKKISDGELQYKIKTDTLTGKQKVMAEYINNIGGGLDAAVENSLKKERMQTELITNVSHDLKTPLTSIINYVDLMKRENPTDPKIQEYLRILDEKSQRLKVLTEDVVEASKASTGNIKLEMNDIDFVEMVQQVIGEFEEKFQEKNLTMMVHFTDEPSIIYADGQRMWRVLENVFGNVVKYAMEGTRVYAEISNRNKKVTFSLKNISAQPLNISADELTERFIRGDVARNTEGSGLGLSIAKSLTELQGGEFKLYLDGDLFKVMITFVAKNYSK